jgi:para-aminobenzoate synthetase component 1
MKRVETRYILKDSQLFKSQVLAWSQQFTSVVWLDSNQHHEKYSAHEAVLAFGEYSRLASDFRDAFDKLKNYQSEINDYIFGYLGYDLKNDVEDLVSENKDNLDFPDLYFFQPKKLLFISGHNVTFKYLKPFGEEITTDFENISKFSLIHNKENKSKSNIKLRIHKDNYLKKVGNILNSIHQGDLYEATFCQEFYAENTHIDPVMVYKNLNDKSKTPFATFLKIKEHYLLSASPERYLKKIGQKVISQPIKGTAKRSNSISEDKKLKEALQQDPKERAENVMIVDLVRNDLSQTCETETVAVEELFGIYSYQYVHQMISTITGKIPSQLETIECIKKAFPMGSMTGAPKLEVIKNIEKLEKSARGLYSGSVGYIDPNGDFDFNVVIRSLIYDQVKAKLSYHVGGAITYDSIPENEYEECLLKAKGITSLFD